MPVGDENNPGPWPMTRRERMSDDEIKEALALARAAGRLEERADVVAYTAERMKRAHNLTAKSTLALFLQDLESLAHIPSLRDGGAGVTR